MALATGLAFGAASMSGIALGATCSMQLLNALSQPPKEQRAPAEHAPPPPPAPPLAPAPAHCVPDPPADHVRATWSRVTSTNSEMPSSYQGFSMAEAREHADEEQLKAMGKSPTKVLEELQRGNARFWTGSSTRPEVSAFSRRALISKQFPTVALLACSDSRVPPEIIFDQGMGSIFVIRVAGNCLATSTMASIQYAVHHLKVKVLVVLGHELCGAVKTAQLPETELDKLSDELAAALKGIKAGLGAERLKDLTDSRALDREAVTTNVTRQVEAIAQDQKIMEKVGKKELMVVGGFYEISSGIVDFFSEVSQ